MKKTAIMKKIVYISVIDVYFESQMIRSNCRWLMIAPFRFACSPLINDGENQAHREKQILLNHFYAWLLAFHWDTLCKCIMCENTFVSSSPSTKLSSFIQLILNDLPDLDCRKKIFCSKLVAECPFLLTRSLTVSVWRDMCPYLTNAEEKSKGRPAQFRN